MLASHISVGVCGAGAMGAGIAQVAAQAGHVTTVFDPSSEALERGRRLVERNVARMAGNGRIAAAEAAAIIGRMSWSDDIGALASCGLVVEAIFEDLDAKRDLFSRLESTLGEEAVIASNTSSLAIAVLAAPLARRSRFLGLHFFNPAPTMRLVEIAPGPDTETALVTAATSFMRDWGKIPVVVRDTPGFIVNRVARPYYSEGWRALEERALDAATLDFLYRDLGGFRMGPLELGDAIGHDINLAAAKSVFGAYFGRTRFTPSVEQAQLVAAGRLGRKSGRGVYDYADDADATEPSFWVGGVSDEEHCDVITMLSDGRTAGQVAAQSGKPVVVLEHSVAAQASTIAFAASDDTARCCVVRQAAASGKRLIEVRDRPGLVLFRTLLQLVNGAADAVRDGIATREEIDLAMINGVNYPFGLFGWGARLGWSKVVSALAAIAEDTGDPIYSPSEVLRAYARAE